MDLKPHKIRYWLHSPEKQDNPETFCEKVNEICDLYLNAQTLSQNGTYVISTDEMTGIQALEQKYEAKLAMPGQVGKIEFEYIRHGTVSLIGFFNIAHGTLPAPYLNQTRTESDFCKAVETLVSTDPDRSWVFVCDGLNTHKSESLVRFVARLCKSDIELGTKGKSGILKNKQTREDFLHDNHHRIRFVYTPKHSSWMNQIEIWFGIISRKLLKRMSYSSVGHLKESILQFIAQYNVSAHPFKWTYAGIPLTV